MICVDCFGQLLAEVQRNPGIEYGIGRGARYSVAEFSKYSGNDGIVEQTTPTQAEKVQGSHSTTGRWRIAEHILVADELFESESLDIALFNPVDKVEQFTTHLSHLTFG